MKPTDNAIPQWQIETPPVGVWAYSRENGLFCIRGKTETNYLIITKLCRFDRKIEVGRTYTVFVDGPFLYPLPDPFLWEMPDHLKAEVAKGKTIE